MMNKNRLIDRLERYIESQEVSGVPNYDSKEEAMLSAKTETIVFISKEGDIMKKKPMTCPVCLGDGCDACDGIGLVLMPFDE